MEQNQKMSPHQVILQLSAEEADALLNLLLCAPETDEVSEEMTALLLRRVAEAQRALLRRTTVELVHEPQHP